MKKLFVSVLAIAAAVACNTAEIVDLPQNPQINFANAFVQNATRADVAADPSTKTADLAAFNVWGFMDEAAGQVFVEELVTKSGDAWGYTNTQYWVKGHTYYFAALANYTNAIVDTAGANTYGLGTVAFDNAAAAGAEDLLYAATSVDATNAIPESPVALTFSHLLSKVKFSFINGFTNELATIDVKNVQITNAPAVGTINLAVENWWDNDDWNVSGSTTLNFGDVCEKLAVGGKQECANECLTIPAAQDYTIKFDVVYYQGSVTAFEAHKEVTLKGVAFEMGKAYNLAAVIDASNVSEDGEELKPIEFTVVEVKDWVEAGTPDAQVKDAELRAAAQFGGKLTLSEDIALQSTLVVTSDLVLDLNGYTLSNKVENAATDVIVVAEGATLTIEGNGTVEAVSGNDGYAVIAEGTVIINGGTFKSGVDTNGEPNAVVYARGNGKVYVNGGYFPNDNESKFVLNKKDADRATTVIEVKGGEFEKFNPANNAAENAGTNFVAEGYAVAINAAGNYVVVPFFGEVTLTEDLALSVPVQVANDLVVDLNGYTLTAPVFTESNGAVLEGDSDSYVFWVKEGATLTINGEGTVAAQNAKYSIAVWAQGGNVVINGGTYTNAGEGADLIYASAGGNVVINGGEFKACPKQAGVDGTLNAYSALNVKDADYRSGASNIVVYGGSFYKFNPANNVSEGANTNFCADGCVAVANGEWYNVIEGEGAVAVATAAELQDALNSGAPVICLSEDVDYGTVTLGELKNVTIYGAANAPVMINTDANTKLENVTLSGINFVYNGSNTNCGVVINKDAQIDNLVLDGCSVVGTGAKAGRGIYGQNPNATIVVKNCVFENLGYPIYTTAAGGYKALTIENCTFNLIKSWAIMPQYNDYLGDLTVTGCTFENCTGGLVKAGKFTSGHTFAFTNNTITNSAEHPAKNWFTIDTSAATAVVSGNVKDGAAWTPGDAEGLK